MTVQQLIDQLLTYDPSLPVFYSSHAHGVEFPSVGHQINTDSVSSPSIVWLCSRSETAQYGGCQPLRGQLDELALIAEQGDDAIDAWILNRIYAERRKKGWYADGSLADPNE